MDYLHKEIYMALNSELDSTEKHYPVLYMVFIISAVPDPILGLSTVKWLTYKSGDQLLWIYLSMKM